MTSILVISTVVVIVGRMTVPGHGLTWAGTYEAFAHIWVGFVLALCIFGPEATLAIGALVFVTLVEIVAFALRGKSDARGYFLRCYRGQDLRRDR